MKFVFLAHIITASYRICIHQVEVSEKIHSRVFLDLGFKDAIIQLHRVSKGEAVLLGFTLGQENPETVINPSDDIYISQCTCLLVLASRLSLVLKHINSITHQTTYASRVPRRIDSVCESKDEILATKRNTRPENTISVQPTLSSGRSFHKLHSASNIYAGIESLNIISPESPLFFDDRNTIHAVIVMVPSKQSDTPCENLLVALICLLKPFRANQPTIPIFVLSEQAHELSRAASEVEHQLALLFQNIHFVLGTGNNPDHLKSVHVDTCDIVMIISPISKRVELPVLEFERILADEGVILTSLNLRFMRQSARFVVELVYHHNSTFLWFPKSPRPTGYPINWTVQSDPPLDEPYESLCPNQSEGFVLSHSMLDSLLIRCVFSPALVAFWENVISGDLLVKMPVPRHLIGHPAARAFEYFSKCSSGIVVGVLNKSRDSICRVQLCSKDVLEPLDELFILRTTNSRQTHTSDE